LPISHPPVTRGRPLRPSRGSLAASSLRVTRREALLAARQARPARAPLKHYGWRTDTPDGSSWQEATARPALPRRSSAVRDRAPPRSHRPVRRTVTSLRRDSAPPRSRPSPRTREPSPGCSSPHARAPHGPVDSRQQPVPGSCDSSLVSRASWPWMNRRRLDGDDRPNDQPHDVDDGERHERPIPPPRAELVPEEWLRRCLHSLCDHHPTVLSLRHARSLPTSAAAIALHRPIARRKLVPPDRERAVPIPVELRCPPSRLDRASQRSPGRETAQLR